MIRIAALATLVALAAAPLEAKPFRANGAFANVFLQDATGCTRALFYVTQDGVHTFVLYQLYDACVIAPDTYWISQGSGVLPASALVVTANSRTARLRFTLTGAEPDFQVLGAVGSVDMTLVRSDDWSIERRVTHRQVFETGVTWKFSGTYTEYNAPATGVVLGYALGVGGDSYLGTTRDLLIEATK
jgi:hypothetical protein